MKLHAPDFLPGDLVLFKRRTDDEVVITPVTNVRFVPKLKCWQYFTAEEPCGRKAEELTLYRSPQLPSLPLGHRFEVDLT